MKLIFVSGNIHKFQEIQRILEEYDIPISFHQQEMPELQSDFLEEIAKFRAQHAFALLRKPLFVEDSGLFIYPLNGFPGPYSSYIFKTIGNSGILRLLHGISDRTAVFRTALALMLSETEILTFIGETPGVIAPSEQGTGGWGYDPIFIPLRGTGQTYGQMSLEEKNKVSHRRQSIQKLAKWVESNSSLLK
ncbi:MAG: XTP/dITP diphosphatase [Candidatus Helarchaeota archaeon]|nr:XTP/dITP diphosphatase [Candidatus Helarchaeota archaeon]